MAKIEQSKKLGVTTVLLQSGLHPDLKMDFYIKFVSETKRRFPGITPYF